MSEPTIAALLVLAFFGTWGALLALILADLEREHRGRTQPLRDAIRRIEARDEARGRAQG